MNDVVVIGGGFAGVSAACRLAGDGHRPILLERAPRLGGRAASFEDASIGETVDDGHHVLMGCCTASQGFLQRIGAASAVRFQPDLRIPIRCEGQTTVLRSAPLPGALHLVPSLLAYQPLSLRERATVLRAGLGLLAGRGGSDTAFSRWLKARGQTERMIARFWDPICIAALNARASDVGLEAARHLFREAFFISGGANLGLFAVPLSDVFAAARAYIEARGGVVRTASSVTALQFEGSAVAGVELADGVIIDAPAVIATVPPADLRRILPDSVPPDRVLGDALSLQWSPIVNAHFWFDRPIMDEPFVIAVDSLVQAVFDLSCIHSDSLTDPAECPRTDGDPQAGKTPDGAEVLPKRQSSVGKGTAHIVLSQSAAGPWIDRPAKEISAELLDALGGVVPSTRDAECVDSLVLKRPRATFIPAPGSKKMRPPTKTRIPGLYLAGDWTGTGWPSTIEGAIRSGVAAAARAQEMLA